MSKSLLTIAVCLLLCSVACWRRQSAESTGSAAAANGTAIHNSDEARSLLEQGKAFYRKDNDEKALEAFKLALSLDPDLAEAHFRIGLSYDALGDVNQAEESYKKAVAAYKKYFGKEENQKDAEAHYNLAQTYAGLHLYGEAVREYRLATKLKEDDADIYYDLGLALTRLAQYDEAVAAFEKSLEIDPENYRAEDGLNEAKEGVKRVRAGRKHQEDLLKKKKEEELKQKEEQGSPAPAEKPTEVAQKP